MTREEVATGMDDSAAARLADRLRAGMKVRALSGAELARRAGRLTGDGEPARMWVSRRIGMAKHPVPLITVSPDLFILAEALGVDPLDVVAGAVRDAIAGTNPYQSLITVSPDLFDFARALELDPVDLVTGAVGDLMVGPNPYQTPNCTHPNRAGTGCPACCDDCNSDRHVCHDCGALTGHNRTVCPDCSEEE